MLNRFIRQVRSNSDTPSLIQLIAADPGYLMLCIEIVNSSAQRKQDSIKPIKAVCQTHGFDFQLLQEKLIPAARALGLTLPPNVQLDYYALLGISPKAGTAEIKKAFRKKVYEVHPDTSGQNHNDNEQFARLKLAYQTLCDPALRMQYNLSRRNLNRWHETPKALSKTNRVGLTSHVIQLMVLIILLVLGIFLFDFLFP